MRYRREDANGDMVFGGDLNAFYIDVPEAPAQAVMTRLGMGLGEWFLDTSDGTPWKTQVLGFYTGSTRDLVIKQRVLGTPGVTDIQNYSSQVSPRRAFTVSMQLNTVYGALILAGPV